MKNKLITFSYFNWAATALAVSFLPNSSFGQLKEVSAVKSEPGVWLILDEPTSSLSADEIRSKSEKFEEVLRKHHIFQKSNPLSNSKNPRLKKVTELLCKECDPKALKADLENLGFGSKENPIEIAPQYEPLHTPNDYSLSPPSNPSDYALNLIQAECAWDSSKGSPSTILAISDTNFYADVNNGGLHEELSSKVVYYDPGNTATRTHGTAVATSAAGRTNNGIGKSAIGYNSRLALYRMNFNDVLLAANSGRRVINMSWSSGCSYNSYLQSTVTEAYQAGAFLIASAGNGATSCGGAGNLVYPAAYDNVFSVTSIGPSDNHEMTVGNPNTTHQHNLKVDLSAPGYNVKVSTMPMVYAAGTGSSFAAPYVTGTVGLMLALNPNLTNAKIEQILKLTSTNIDPINPSYAGLIGKGRLNSCAAVKAVKNPLRATITFKNLCSQNQSIADLQVAGGTSPYSYSWSNGATTQDLTGPAPGSYSVTVTDALGFTNTKSIQVPSVPTSPPIVVTEVVSNPTGNLSNGSINITVSGQVPQSFLWSKTGGNFTATSEDVTGLTSGTYSVTVIGSSGCQTSKSFTLQ
jgi:hypothetical protein